MSSRQIVNQYYDAWRERAGDMTGVPLADNFTFIGPVAAFDTAEGYRAMAKQAGAAVRAFRVRHQFADGDLVCSIIDWEMAPLPGVLTAAEVLQVQDGTIVRGELIYDAEELRHAMRRAAPAGAPLVELLRRGYAGTAAMIAEITAKGWAAASPCAGWTVRQAGNHLVGSIDLLARVAERAPIDPSELDPQALANTDRLGRDPAAAFRAVADRSAAIFNRPGILDEEFPFISGPVPGAVLANISLVESLVHGWDLARGASAPYDPDPEVVATVGEYTRRTIGEDQRKAGLFGPPIPTGPDAEELTSLLGHLGRRA
jgi:uncharacterized protein (TIGR03086 family)